MAGLKMSEARFSAGSSATITAANENENDGARKTRVCKSCGVPITYRRAYKQMHGKVERSIRAHYASLHKHPHVQGCCYDIGAEIERIAAISDKLPSGREELMKRISYGNVEMRLHIIGDEMKHLESTPAIISPGEAPISTTLRTGNAHLTAYLAQAAQVVRLYFQIEGNSARKELARRVKIVDHGKRIPWNDFLYDIGSYGSLYKLALSKAGVPHMIALVVRPKTADPTSFLKTIRCHYESPKPEKYVIPRSCAP